MKENDNSIPYGHCIQGNRCILYVSSNQYQYSIVPILQTDYKRTKSEKKEI